MQQFYNNHFILESKYFYIYDRKGHSKIVNHMIHIKIFRLNNTCIKESYYSNIKVISKGKPKDGTILVIEIK